MSLHAIGYVAGAVLVVFAAALVYAHRPRRGRYRGT